MKDPYEVLGVGRGAPQDEIAKAYRRLCLRYHPDKHGQADPELYALAEERFKEVRAAYESILQDGAAGPSAPDAAPSGAGRGRERSIPPADWSDAVRTGPATSRPVPLGQILLSQKVLSAARLRAALYEQASAVEHRRIGEILVARGHCSEREIAMALSTQRGLKFVDLTGRWVAAELARLVPLQVATALRVVPVALRAGRILLAVSDPDALPAAAALRSQIGLDYDVAIAAPRQVGEALAEGRYGKGTGKGRDPAPWWLKLLRLAADSDQGLLELLWSPIVRRVRWLTGFVAFMILLTIVTTMYALSHPELGPVGWVPVVTIGLGALAVALYRAIVG